MVSLRGGMKVLDCIFCKIVQGEIPAKKVYEDKDYLAFHDISPKAKVHVLIVPKRHLEPAQGFKREDSLILSGLFIVAEEVAKKEGIFDSGYRLIVNSGPHSGQEVSHLHMHLLGGEELGALVGK
jgi:histidine triad (HIT) family protein